MDTQLRSGQEAGHLRLSCGQEVTVGRLNPGDAGRSGQRIFLDLGECQAIHGSSRANMTLAEARQLARGLLAEAAAGEQEAQNASLPASRVAVRHIIGDAFAISVRGHAVLVDQPAGDGGQDAAATPTELFVGSLASCVAFYAGRYLQRHGLDRTGLAVTADFAMADDRPARVADIVLRISVPAGVPAQRRDALLAVASHCTVHNTLRHEPRVSVAIESSLMHGQSR